MDPRHPEYTFAIHYQRGLDVHHRREQHLGIPFCPRFHGGNAADTCLALPGSTYSSVRCPHGFEPSMVNHFCCHRSNPLSTWDGTRLKRLDVRGTYDDREPPRKMRVLNNGDAVSRFGQRRRRRSSGGGVGKATKKKKQPR